MKNSYLNKVFMLLIVVIMVLLAFVGCGKIDTMKRIEEKKVIVMGTESTFPPFEYRNDKNEVDGLDVAIAEAIAEELGVELKVEDMDFNSLLNALKSGKIDFVAAGMSVDEDRLKNADFSDGYYTASQKIIVQKDNDEIMGKDDLKGKKIGVQEGTTGDLEASEIEDVKMSRFKSNIDAIMDLRNGKIDAVVLDESPAEVFISKNDDITILDEELTDEEYAIAIRKGDTELTDLINKVIKDLKDSGEFDELVVKYFEEANY